MLETDHLIMRLVILSGRARSFELPLVSRRLFAVLKDVFYNLIVAKLVVCTALERMKPAPVVVLVGFSDPKN